MKKPIIISAFVLISLIAGSVIIYSSIGEGQDRKEGDSPKFQTAKVERGNITEIITASGTIEPLTIVEVSSKASGKIIKMDVDEGDYLEAGEVIAEIEKTYAQNDLEQAQADLISAQARLEQAKLSIELEKKQREIQVEQARLNLEDAQTRLAQLEEEFKLEKEANARKLLEAENNLKIAELQLKLLMPESVRPEEIERAKASLAQAKSNLDLAEKEAERLRVLYEKKFVPKTDLDTALSKLESARAQYNSAVQQLKLVETPAQQENIDLARANVEKAKLALKAAQEAIASEKARAKDIDLQRSKVEMMKTSLELAEANLAQISIKEKDLLTSQASLKRSEIQLETMKEKLNDTVVVAPISGTILEKNVEEGQVITSRTAMSTAEGATLVTMADLSKIYVKTDVDETDIGKVKEGNPVSIQVDAFPNKRFRGRVLKIAPRGKVTQNVTTFTVTTELLDRSDELRPGMNATVEIVAADVKDVLVVPSEAVMERGGRKMVMVVGADGRPEPRQVETGASSWEKTQILSGLQEGEEVIIGGFTGAGSRPGAEFMQRIRQDPSSSIRMMQGGGPGGRPPR